MIHSRQTLPNIASKRNMICSVPLCNVSRMDSNDLDSPGKRLQWAREKAGFQQAGDFAKRGGEIGRASCRERGGQYGRISVVAVALKKKIRGRKNNTEQ